MYFSFNFAWDSISSLVLSVKSRGIEGAGGGGGGGGGGYLLDKIC